MCVFACTCVYVRVRACMCTPTFYWTAALCPRPGALMGGCVSQAPDVASQPRPVYTDVLQLPLRFHFFRSETMGVPLDVDEAWFMLKILPQINTYYKKHGIRWESSGCVELNVAESASEENMAMCAEARAKTNKINRQNAAGNNDIRREVFLKTLVPQYKTHLDTYDVYLFDFIGDGFQGVTWFDTRTVVMGLRSTKGYTSPTRRPDACLAKTAAHELGHALGLGHPKGKTHPDGVSQLFDTRTGRENPDNLMCGGKDSNGGGGTDLLQWQVDIVRKEARNFLDAYGPRPISSA